jgi:hypothetical protein
MLVVDSPTHLRTNIALQHEPGAGEVFGGVVSSWQRRVCAQGEGFDVPREANGKGIVSRLIERASKRSTGKKNDTEEKQHESHARALKITFIRVD